MVDMIVKVHKTPNGILLAICDSDIIGKVFEEGEKQLDLTAEFYDGETTSKDDLDVLLKECHVINAVGKVSVGFLISKKLVEECNVLEIDSVPTAQCVIEI